MGRADKEEEERRVQTLLGCGSQLPREIRAHLTGHQGHHCDLPAPSHLTPLGPLVLAFISSFTHALEEEYLLFCLSLTSGLSSSSDSQSPSPPCSPSF